MVVSSVVFSAEESMEATPGLEQYDNQLNIEPLWSDRVSVSFGKRYIKLRPQQFGDAVYSADWRGEVLAHQLESGELLWQKSLEGIITGGVTASDEMVLLGGAEGEVIALHPQSGELLWRSQLSSEILAPPLHGGGYVVVHSNDGYIYGLSAQTGEQQWVYQYKVPALTLRGTSSPVLSGNLVVVGLDNGRLVALDLQSGSVSWEQTIAVPQGRSELQRMVDIDATPLLIDGMLYVVSFQGRVAALEASSGRVVWIRDFSSYSGMDADHENLYVSDSEGVVYAINRQNGASLWKQEQLKALILSHPVVSQAEVIVAADDGYLYWLSRQSGELLSRISSKELVARLKGMEWNLWTDYDRSGLPEFYDEDVGINIAPQRLSDGSLLVLDNQGYLTRFSH